MTFFVRTAVAVAVLLCATQVWAQSPATQVKVAFFNIQSGKGEPGLRGRVTPFVDSGNCTDPSLPKNAWGTGFIQQHLIQSVGNDPAVVALGLAEAWGCGNVENVRLALGWAAASSERNGVAMVARFGFAGPEEWVQLDTTLNLNPNDTMWVLRRAVCVDAACTTNLPVFAAHWFGSGDNINVSYDRQAAGTTSFLLRAGGQKPHVLIGDLNVFEGAAIVCEQSPNNIGLQRLRAAGYLDAWPLLHGSAEGFTGMTNRAGCGTPEGYVWKRPDYAWSPSWYAPLSMIRFGVVPPGEPAPSDHYGIIAGYPMPPPSPLEAGPPPAPVPAPVPPAPEPLPPPISPGGSTREIVLHARSAGTIAGNWQVVSDTSAAGGARVWMPDRGAPKLTSASATPPDYFDLTFDAEADRPYRVWLRGRADHNAWTNDSVFVQFSNSVDAAGAQIFRIGSTDATVVSIEACSGCGLAGWGWQDNGYGVAGPAALGPTIRFSTSGRQTIRIQGREDGVSIDQIVLSSERFMTSAPGHTLNDATILETVEAPPQDSTSEILLHTRFVSAIVGDWRLVGDTTAASGARIWNRDLGLPKLPAAFAAPADYFELTFNAEAGKGYRLWVHGRADNNDYRNDSVFVQFSQSVTAAGAPVFRIGSVDATVVSIEPCGGCGLNGWGWQDNGYDSLGPLVYFATSGPQKIRVQRREDGISIDQIVLSSTNYLSSAPVR